ncbi:hypothetical protein TBK1r_21230 [Stieleria magnilauensis]|uniref:Uncharacterized protein n=1 Tax=Stieleria magnilauensis TaxID=2527963 RepID=A0ABX5XMH5_9BACT|nr:hypothetical protein TBK1r_21230 [Planctomycetes bacterium TBK1r]
MHFMTDRARIVRRDFGKLCTGIAAELEVWGLLSRSADADELSVQTGSPLGDSYL